MAKLVDTSSWVAAIRANGSADVKERIRALGEQDQAVWCDVVRMELWNGCRGERDKHQVRLLELTLKTLPIDDRTWALAVATIRAGREAGFTFSVTDTLIAACAVRHGVDVETSDQHFLPLLQIARRRAPGGETAKAGEVGPPPAPPAL